MKKKYTLSMLVCFTLELAAFAQTWEQLPYYFPKTIQSTPQIFASPNDVLVAGISYNSAPKSHISQDGGTTWQQIFSDKPIISAEFGPDGTIYFISSKRYLTTSNYNIDTLFTSGDGINWTNMGYKLRAGEKDYDFTISGNNTLLFSKDANGFEDGLSKSTDNGVSWSLTSLLQGPVTCSYSADTIIRSFDSPWPGGIHYSHDGGATVNTATGIAVSTIPVYLPNGEIYAAAIGQIYKSLDGGASFVQVPLNASVSQIQEFFYASNGKFYIRVLNGIWETSNFTDVTAITSNLPDYDWIKDMDISNNYIYAITDTNLYRYPISGSAGLDSAPIKTASVSIYPNPTKGELFMTADFAGNATIDLYDLRGKKVLTETVLFQKQLASKIDLPVLENGLYLLHLKGEHGEQFQQKIAIN